MNTYFMKLPVILIVALLGLQLTGCRHLTQTERGAAVGAGAGAVVGGVIGAATGSTVRGAIIGAAVGGVAGAVIGQQMDRQAEELERDLEDARVERIGEGIYISFDSPILFDFDSATLRPAARSNLNQLAQSLQRYPDTAALVVGHTDSTGPADYNQRLSERRAQSVGTYLIQQGVGSNRLRMEGRGEFEPIASNETAEGRQLNRRVEIAIYASDEYRERLQREHN